MLNDLRVSAIVNCAGRGVRFGGNKLLELINGSTVLELTVAGILHPLVDEVIVTVSEEFEVEYRRILVDTAHLPVTLVRGADERHLSAYNGFRQTSGDLVMVHDGVRPFVSPELITVVLEAGAEHGAAMLGLPSTVQVKLVSSDEFVTGSLDRAGSWLGQTPQVFHRDILGTAYARAVSEDYHKVSDDADLVAHYTGRPVKIVEGHVDNIKITTPQDLQLAQLIARERSTIPN